MPKNPRDQRTISARRAPRKTISSARHIAIRRRGERAQQQHGNEQGEHDHLLKVGGVEGGEGFDRADGERSDGGQRIADKAADDGGDEALQSDQEAGVVIERCDRHDQDARERADHRGEQERDLARQPKDPELEKMLKQLMNRSGIRGDKPPN